MSGLQLPAILSRPCETHYQTVQVGSLPGRQQEVPCASWKELGNWKSTTWTNQLVVQEADCILCPPNFNIIQSTPEKCETKKPPVTVTSRHRLSSLSLRNLCVPGERLLLADLEGCGLVPKWSESKHGFLCYNILRRERNVMMEKHTTETVQKQGHIWG